MIEKTKLGMLLFIVSEAIFFVLLIFAYIYFCSVVKGSDIESMAAANLDPVKTGLFTLSLVGSSVTMWLAGRSLKRERHRMLCVWLFATLLLGAIFLIGQGMEYARLLARHITVSHNLFGTTFFTLTGFHGLHVLLGLVMLMIVLGLTIGGTFTGRRSAAVDTVSLYWHFVDAVWLVIFTVVYLGGVR